MLKRYLIRRWLKQIKNRILEAEREGGLSFEFLELLGIGDVKVELVGQDLKEEVWILLD